jgi:hypothetical protein
LVAAKACCLNKVGHDPPTDCLTFSGIDAFLRQGTGLDKPDHATVTKQDLALKQIRARPYYSAIHMVDIIGIGIGIGSRTEQRGKFDNPETLLTPAVVLGRDPIPIPIANTDCARESRLYRQVPFSMQTFGQI